MNVQSAVVFIIALCASVGNSHANLLTNGSFETPALAPGDFVTITPGTEPAGLGWTVTTGSVDVGDLPNAFIDFPAFDGDNGLDLNGLERGALFQDFATSAGQQYRVSFVYSDNPFEAGISFASIDITSVGTGASLLAESVSHSTASNGSAAIGDGDPDFDTFHHVFIATSSLTRIAFASTSSSNTPSGGILVDAVSVVAVPEPASLILLALGASMFGLRFIR